MNRSLWSIILIAIIVAACSPASSERAQNEEKLQKLGQQIGGDAEDIAKNLDQMTDEEIAEAAKYVNEEGEVDLEVAMDEEASEEENKANKMDLQSIEVECETVEDPASRKLTNTKIQLLGCADEYEGLIGGCMEKSDLNGQVDIKIHSIRAVNPDDSWTEYEKGNLLIEFSGNINDVAPLTYEEQGIFGKRPVYQFMLGTKDIDGTDVEYSTQDEYPDEYGRTYERIPLVIDVDYQENDKTYLYRDYVSEFMWCDLVREVKS